jgi:hypothetical protein
LASLAQVIGRRLGSFRMSQEHANLSASLRAVKHLFVNRVAYPDGHLPFWYNILNYKGLVAERIQRSRAESQV